MGGRGRRQPSATEPGQDDEMAIAADEGGEDDPARGVHAPDENSCAAWIFKKMLDSSLGFL